MTRTPSALLCSALLLSTLAACKKEAPVTKDEVVDEEGGGDGGAQVEPLSFTMTGPPSGDFEPGSTLTATGTWSGGAAPTLTVNGAASSPAAGEWSVSTDHSAVLWPDSPLWPVLAEASDTDGAWIRGRRTVIHGEAVSAEAPVPAGLVMRLTDELLVDLTPVLDDAVAGLDLSSLLVSTEPVASLLGAEVYITGASFGALLPDFDFKASGLNYSLRVEAVVVYITLDFGFLGDTEVELRADALTVFGDIIFGVDASGGLTATAANTDVSTENIELFGITDSFGLVDLLLGDTLAGQVEGLVIDTLGGLLEAQESLRRLEFSGLIIESDFTSVNHDEEGVNLVATSRVTAEGEAPDQRLTTPSAFGNPRGATTPSGVPFHAGLYLDDDLISALGGGLIASGLLVQEVSGDLGSLTLDTSLLGGFIAGFDTLPPGQPVTIRTRPTVAPVGTTVEEPGVALALHLGGLELDLLTDQDGDGADDVVMTVVVDAIIGVTAGEEGALIGVELLDSSATLLSTSLPATPAEVEPGLSTLIGVAVPLLVGDLLGSALSFDLGGITITTLDAGAVDDHGALYLELDPSGFTF